MLNVPKSHRHGERRHCVPVRDIVRVLYDEEWLDTKRPSESTLRSVLRAFQVVRGLPTNGYVGYRTARALGLLPTAPLFCGLPERIVISGRAQWPRGQLLTWAIESKPPIADFQEILNTAFGAWPEACEVNIGYNGNPRTSNLKVIAADLGGPFGVLADCEVPYGTKAQLTMRFDSRERWGQGGNEIDPLRVARHECGHFLGSLHLSVGNLMAAQYSPEIADLQAGDKREGVLRYGERIAPAPPAPTPPADVYRVILESEKPIKVVG